jgi:hypothetical protein
MIKLQNECKANRPAKYYIISKISPLLTSVFSSEKDWKENIHIDKTLYGEDAFTSGKLEDLKEPYEIVDWEKVTDGSLKGVEEGKYLENNPFLNA